MLRFVTSATHNSLQALNSSTDPQLTSDLSEISFLLTAACC